MTRINDETVSVSIGTLKRIIEAAQNGNHAGEIAAVRAANAKKLEDVVRLLLPEVRNSITAGDGRFTWSQVAACEQALRDAAGIYTPSIREAAE